MHKILLHWFVKGKSMDQFEMWKAILRKDLRRLVFLKTSHRRKLSSFVFLSWNAEDVSKDGVASGSRSKP